MSTRVAISTLLAALVIAPAASGHVTVNPNEAPADSFFRFAVRVPTERPVATTKITMQLPDGLFFVSFERKDGWKRTVKTEKLDEPVELFGQEITERVATVTWSGSKIGPGEFEEFGISARLPNAPGTELVFPALQTYANGEVVRWVGPEDAEQPAPRVTLAEPEEEGASEPASAASRAEAAPAADTGDDASGRANLALGFGIAGLVAGVAALALALRPRRA